jgi:hypothetical protein
VDCEGGKMVKLLSRYVKIVDPQSACKSLTRVDRRSEDTKDTNNIGVTWNSFFWSQILVMKNFKELL